MAYIVQRNHRFYVVAYDGTDPATGRERRRWLPAGHSRADAEAIAASLHDTNRAPIVHGHDALTLGEYLPTHGFLGASGTSGSLAKAFTKAFSRLLDDWEAAA